MRRQRISSTSEKIAPSSVLVVENCRSCKITKDVVIGGDKKKSFTYSYAIGCGPEIASKPEKGPGGDVYAIH